MRVFQERYNQRLALSVNKTSRKLVKVNEGAIFDVAADIRKKIKNFAIGVQVLLMITISNYGYLRFCSWFLVLSDIARVSYKCTTIFSR